MNGLEREEQMLEEDLANGLITQKEYNSQMRDLYACLEQEAEDAAEAAYDSVMGSW